jgi:hypothetical protein
MASLIYSVLQAGGGECRDGGAAGRFLYFSAVRAGFVAREMTPAGDKIGGGGVNSPGLPWAFLVLTAHAANNVVISAYPTDDNYRLGKPLLV